MNEILAQVINKTIKLSSKNFGNKMDNSIAKVIFNEIDVDGLFENKYVAFLNPKKEIFLFPLNSEDNSFIVTLTITQYPGTWKMLYLATGKEIIDGEIDTNYKSYVSNSIDFTISDNFLNDTIEDVIVDENLSIIYEELEQTIIYLNSEDFKEDLINSLHISESDIETIINNIKNDEEFIESIKGEPGKDGSDGKSAYQEWLDLGNEGSEEDFINSLKGQDGSNGKDFTYEDFTEEQLESLKGQDGQDGFSPIVDISKKNNTTTIKITDKDKTQAAFIDDGVGIRQEYINSISIAKDEEINGKTYYWNLDNLQIYMNYKTKWNGKTVLKTDKYVYIFNANDYVFNVYEVSNLETRVSWINISEILNKAEGTGTITFNTDTIIESIDPGLLLREEYLSINEYAEAHLRGKDGEKGDPFEYEDFTPEQLEALRGPAGPAGANGKNGSNGYSPTISTSEFNTETESGYDLYIQDQYNSNNIRIRNGLSAYQDWAIKNPVEDNLKVNTKEYSSYANFLLKNNGSSIYTNFINGIGEDNILRFNLDNKMGTILDITIKNNNGVFQILDTTNMTAYDGDNIFNYIQQGHQKENGDIIINVMDILGYISYIGGSSVWDYQSLVITNNYASLKELRQGTEEEFYAFLTKDLQSYIDEKILGGAS